MKCLKGIRQIKGLMKEEPEDWRKCQLTCKVNESELGVRFVSIESIELTSWFSQYTRESVIQSNQIYTTIFTTLSIG